MWILPCDRLRSPPAVTECLRDMRVQNGECVHCPPGQVNEPGDLRNGGNTECRPGIPPDTRPCTSMNGFHNNPYVPIFPAPNPST